MTQSLKIITRSHCEQIHVRTVTVTQSRTYAIIFTLYVPIVTSLLSTTRRTLSSVKLSTFIFINVLYEPAIQPPTAMCSNLFIFLIIF